MNPVRSPSDLVPELARLGVRSLKIEGRLKGPAYVAATTALYRKAVDALAGGEAPAAEDRALALGAYSRGSGAGFLHGVDHQRLVEGRGCEHRGLEVGATRGTAKGGRRREIRVTLSAALACVDGVLVEGGLAGAGEIGALRSQPGYGVVRGSLRVLA